MLNALRLTFVLIVVSESAAFAQDVARMEQVVQSYVGNKTFAGSVLVARDAAGNVAEFVMLQGTRQERATRVK